MKRIGKLGAAFWMSRVDWTVECWLRLELAQQQKVADEMQPSLALPSTSAGLPNGRPAKAANPSRAPSRPLMNGQ